jgi:Icc-related predicted phosphoesterase
MRYWFISDTHEKHEYLEVPEDIDVVVHCGDEANSVDPYKNVGPSQKFFDWFDALDIPKKIFVPGNHSTAFREGLVKTHSVRPLVDSFRVVAGRTPLTGTTMFGSPWTPAMPRGKKWAYTRKRNTMDQVWRGLPYCEILVTHGPPKGIMDLTYDTLDSKRLIHCGCKSLATTVRNMKPKIHAFGHVHDEKGCDNRGIFNRGGITYINCSCINLSGSVVGNGEVIEI